MKSVRCRPQLAAMAIAGAVLAAAAVLAPAQAAHPPGGVFYGANSAGGTITFWLDAAGTRVTGFDVTLPSSSVCPGGHTFVLTTAPVVNHAFSATVNPAAQSSMQNIAVAGEFTSDESVSGTLSWSGAAGCGSGSASFKAPRSRSTGTFTAGDLPLQGGFGLAVFGGGAPSGPSFAALAAGCGPPASTFWVSEAGQFVQYVPGSQVQAVNAAWFEKFRLGIPPGTGMIVRCRLQPS